MLPAGVTPSAPAHGAGLGPDGLPTVLSNPAITPDVAVIDFDLKFLPDERPADVRREFEGLVHAFAQMDSWLREHPPEVKWEPGGLHFPPMETPIDHPLVRAMTANRAAMGLETQIKGFVAVSDIAHYAGAGVPGFLFGPGGAGPACRRRICGCRLARRDGAVRRRGDGRVVRRPLTGAEDRKVGPAG